MEKNSKIIDCLLDKREPYILRIDNMKVEMTYSKNDKSFKECMTNILKQKAKIS